MVAPSRRAPSRRQRRGLRDEAGGSALEFALLLPVLLVLLVGILEYGLLFFARLSLDEALGEAARFGITGRTLPGQDRTEAVRQVLRQRLPALLDPDRVVVDVLVYPDFESIGRPEPFVDRNGNGTYDAGEPYTDINGNGRWDEDMGRPGAGGPDAVVLYRARTDWRLLTPLAPLLVPPDGRVPLESTIAVRNEPFPGGDGS